MHLYERIRYPFDHIKENPENTKVPRLMEAKLSTKKIPKSKVSKVINLSAAEGVIGMDVRGNMYPVSYNKKVLTAAEQDTAVSVSDWRR